MFFKLTKVSAFHSGLTLYETLSFFNFFAGCAQIGAFRYGAPRRNIPQFEMAAAIGLRATAIQWQRRFMYCLLLNSLDAHSQLAYYPSG